MAGKFNWLRRHLNETEQSQLEKQLSQLEEKYQIDLVPMICRRSSFVATNRLTIGFLLYVIFVFAIFAFENFLYVWELRLLIFLMFPVSFMLAWFTAEIDFLQRFLIPNGDEDEAVRRRACAEFLKYKLDQTHGRQAILIFVSVMERRAFLLPDLGLQAILTPEKCHKMVQTMTAEFKRGSWLQGYQALIDLIRLETSLPTRLSSTNELSEKLIILDP